MIDFEYMDMGHPGLDIGYLFVYSYKRIRDLYMERFLQRYY